MHDTVETETGLKTTSGWARAMFAGALATLLLAAPARADVIADVIADWNARADAIALEQRVPPLPHARGMAILHVAMFEAVNAIERRYAPYRLALSADATASKEAAAAAAAHAVLVALYPEKRGNLDADLAASLSGGAARESSSISQADARQKGLRVGEQAAMGILALRADDGAKVGETYRPRTSPGAYVPTVVPAFSTWAGVTPWTMQSGSQFRPAAPPALASESWSRDLNEIREIGARGSVQRSAAQTDIGRFWFFTGPTTYDPIVRQVTAAKKLDLVDSARAFALVAMAAADAHIAVFEAKYTYNLWRPITAIRNADRTENEATPREASWLPLGDTPMHPEYPCAHCITSAAVSTVLQALVGNEVAEISLTSPTAPGIVRKWTRLQDYSDEVSLARIYAGFHYRFSTEVGKDMGRKIGALTVGTQLRGAVASADARR